MKTINCGRFGQLLVAVSLTAIGSTVCPSLASAVPINYALGASATASSTYSSFLPGLAVDDAVGTRWNADTHAAWWQVDLGSIAYIDVISISSMQTSGLHVTFSLTSRTDLLSSWLPIVSNHTEDSVPAYWTYTQTVNAQMRYIRYEALGDASSDWASIFDFQAIGEGPSQVPEPASLLLLGTGLFGVVGAIRRRMRK